jgi:hypothetical protein
MSKLQAAYWLLVVVPWVVSLVIRQLTGLRVALRIREKNLRPHIIRKSSHLPPCTPRAC